VSVANIGGSGGGTGSNLPGVVSRLIQKTRTQPGYVPANPDGLLIVLGSPGSVLATGVQPGVLIVPEAYLLSGVVLVADQSGSCVLDIKRAAYAATPSYSSIVASAPPTLSSAVASKDVTLTGWTKALAQFDILQFSVTSASTLNWVAVCLIGRRLLGG